MLRRNGNGRVKMHLLQRVVGQNICRGLASRIEKPEILHIFDCLVFNQLPDGKERIIPLLLNLDGDLARMFGTSRIMKKIHYFRFNMFQQCLLHSTSDGYLLFGSCPDKGCFCSAFEFVMSIKPCLKVSVNQKC